MARGLVLEESRARHEEIQNIIKEIRQNIWIGLVITGSWPWILQCQQEPSLQYFSKYAPYFSKYAPWIPVLAVTYFLARYIFQDQILKRVAKYLKEEIEQLYPEGVSGWETWLPRNATARWDFWINCVFWLLLLAINLCAAGVLHFG